MVSICTLQNSSPKTFREAFRGIRSTLENRLDTTHGLMDQLLQRGVLLPAHVEDICQVLPASNYFVNSRFMVPVLKCKCMEFSFAGNI